MCWSSMVVLGLLISLPCLGQKSPNTEKPAVQAGRDPAAVALRDKMLRAYREMRGIREKITQRQWQSAPDQALMLEIEFRFKKPNQMYLAIDYPLIEKEGRWRLIYASDGKTLTVYNSARNEFQTVKAPARLDKLVLPLALRSPEFLVLLRDANPFEELEKSAIVTYSEAFENANGRSSHILKLALQQDGAKRNLRYQVDPKDNLLRGFTLTILPDAETASPFADVETASTVQAEYTLVEANPRFSDADFRFAPPPGATEKDSAPDDAPKRAGKKPSGK